MAKLILRLFGGFHAESAGKTLPLQTDKIRALLIWLYREADRPHRRDRLAALFWPDWEDAIALRNLRQSLHRLGRAVNGAAPDLSADLLTITRQDVTLHSQFVTSDVADFEQGLSLPGQHSHTSLADCATCFNTVHHAVDLYHGEFAAGLVINDAAPAFEIWLTSQRAVHFQAMMQGLADLADAALVQADPVAALTFAQRQLTLDPWREAAHRQVMRALVASGQRTQAIQQFHLCRMVLAEELGVDPEPETAALFQALLEPEEAPVPLAPPSRPSRRSIRTNLPEPVTNFVGRQTEIQELMGLCEGCRLLTLTGPGGSGKSRLAVELGRRLLDRFPDGVWLVELAEVQDPRRVAHAVAHVLGVGEMANQDLPHLLADHLQHRTLLLILDNCEHLLDACADLSQRLLSHSPRLRILATSREGLTIPGEQIWPVPALSLPASQEMDLAVLSASPAVSLFVDRAMAQRPDFRLIPENAIHVAEICRRLDGIPLALELAAARLRGLTPAQIAGLLDDRFRLLTGGSRTALPRQKTLRGLIDWSHDLLSPAEKILFRRLAIFVGGATLSDMTEVCAEPDSAPGELAVIGSEPVLDLLLRLVDKSMVIVRGRSTQPRYAMLDTIHAYALERLADSGEAEKLAARHARLFARLAMRAEVELIGGEDIYWLNRLDQEDENLMAALEWAFEKERPALGIQLAGSLAYYWDARNRLDDSGRWLAVAWERMNIHTPILDQARLASGLGTLAWKKVRYVEAHRWHQQALELYQRGEDDRGIAFSLHNLAIQQSYLGDEDGAMDLLRRSISVAEESGQTGMLAVGLSTLGNHYLRRGQIVEAGPPLEQATRLLRQNNAQRILGYALSSLLEYYLLMGQPTASWQAVEEMAQVAEVIGDRSLIAASHAGRAFVLHAEQRSQEAFEASLLALAEIVEFGINTYTVEVLELLACTLAGMGQAQAALKILTVCDSHRRMVLDSRPFIYQTEYDRALAAIETRLSDLERADLRTHAATLRLEQILAYALSLADLTQVSA